MNPCDPIRSHLIEWVYNELPIQVRTTIEEHLTICSACREHLQTLESAHDQLDAVSREAVEPITTAQLLRRAQSVERTQRRRWRKPAALAAACLAMWLVAWISGVDVEMDRHHVAIVWHRRPIPGLAQIAEPVRVNEPRDSYIQLRHRFLANSELALGVSSPRLLQALPSDENSYHRLRTRFQLIQE